MIVGKGGGYQNGGKKQWEISGNFEDEKRLEIPSWTRPSTICNRLRRVVRGEAKGGGVEESEARGRRKPRPWGA